MQKNEFMDLFFEAILTLENKDECYKFFSDACTPKEIDTIAQRFAVAKMLNEKKVYNEIIEKTGASTATISRVSRAINEGFQTAFERLGK
jgi:TrpR-related protein YerC/YecD